MLFIQTPTQKPKTYGSFSFNAVVIIYLPIIVLTPCYTYYMCVIKNKECKPFPHSTITQTANHYPQNTFFRFFMGIGATIFVLIFNTLFRWINTQAQAANFPRMSRILYFAMMFAILTYCIAVQTIDGYGNGPLHTPSAVIFFLIFQITIVYVTLYLYRLRQWDSSIVSQDSMLLKSILCFYITGVWIYCLYNSIGENSIDYSVVLQWNCFAINVSWLLSFVHEWKKIKICLVQS